MMKKILSCLLIIPILMFAFGSCSDNDLSHDGITIVCTTFPHYDWLREILGENPTGIELVLLLDNGVDLHSYQPTTDDVITISTCDLFVYIGGESDSWVGDVLKTMLNDDMVVINLMETLKHMVKVEEVIEGMEHDEDDHGDDTEYDEHIWLSLRNAQYACTSLANAVSALDTDNTDLYQANANEYNNKLIELDKQYELMIAEASCTAVLFGDRFPFRYLIDDYGLDYYAAFTGCSAETEASFETITFLVDKLNELELENVMVVETSDQSIARTIIQNSSGKSQSIRILNSMQSVTAADSASGVTYLSIMADNLNVLREVLN